MASVGPTPVKCHECTAMALARSVTGKIYGVPVNTDGPAVNTPQREESVQPQRARRRRDNPEPEAEAAMAQPRIAESRYKSGDRTDFKLPDTSEIKLGAHYDHRVYYDFTGAPYFLLESAMATQLNISDCNKDLIPPWELYDAFRPGALIMAVVQVSTFGFLDRSRVHKSFQLEAKQIWVYDEGDGPVALRCPPVPCNPMEFSPSGSIPYTPDRGTVDLFTNRTPATLSTLTLASKNAVPSSSQETLDGYNMVDDEDTIPELPPKKSRQSAAGDKTKLHVRGHSGAA